MRSLGWSYQRIHNEFPARTGESLSNDTQIVRGLRSTALGYDWNPRCEGGRPGYLCLEDERRLATIITESARDLNSIPKWVVSNLAHEMKIERTHCARFHLMQIACPKIAASIPDPDEPDETWVNAYAQRWKMRIKNSEQIEQIRRTTCDRLRVSEWFAAFGPVIASYHPSLVFNMDETGVSSNRKYKVVVPLGMSGVIPGGGKHQHITGIVCYNAYGDHPKPGVILSQLRNMPQDLTQFGDNADFYSSPTGWITSDVFGKWCVNFAHWIRRWRKSLDPVRQQSRVLLLMDGHTSRRNLDAIHYLWCNGIDVLTFPGHCTHVMQPFDVAVAAPLKAALRKEIQKIEAKIKAGWFRGWTQAAVKRYTLVAAFLEGFHKAVTPMNSRSSFQATGIFPLNAFQVLNSRYVTTPQHAMCPQEWQNSMLVSSALDICQIAGRVGRFRNGNVVDLMRADELIMARPCGSLLTRPEAWVP